MTPFLFLILLFNSPILKITYNGNKSIPSRELNQAILSRIKGEYSESILNQDVERIIRAYYNKGFFSPTVKTKTREISNGIEIIFDIKEGPRPKIKEIRIEDDQKDYPKDLLRLKLGDFFIQEGIRESQKKIENFYKEKGYAFAEASFSIIPDSGILAFSVKKGDKFYIKDILISGLRSTNPMVVQREIEFKKGDIYSEKKLFNSRRRIYSLGFYSMVNVELLKETTDSLSLIFTIRELKTRVLNFGTGISFPLGFLLSLGLEELNLFNRGHRLKIEPSFKINTKREWEAKFEVHYLYPYLTPFKLNASIIPFYWYENQEEFAKSTRGFELRFSKIYSENIQANIGNKYRYVNYQPKLALLDTVEGVTNSIRLQLMLDYRDEFFNPKKGLYSSLLTEYAGGILGGANNFLRLEDEIRLYLEPFERIILAGRLKLGSLIPTDGVSIDEKYFVGGQYTLRGYEEKSLGPDSIGDDHYGNYLVNLNSEVRIALVKNLGMVIFLDAAGVNNRIDFKEKNHLGMSAGLGLRYNTPLGPIRVDLGIPLWEKGYGIYLGLYHIF